MIDEIATGYYSPPGAPDLFRPVVESLLMRDEYLVLADYRSYIEAQDRGGPACGDDPAAWTAMSIRNSGALRVLLLGPLDAGLLRPDLALSLLAPRACAGGR